MEGDLCGHRQSGGRGRRDFRGFHLPSHPGGSGVSPTMMLLLFCPQGEATAS